MVPAEVRQGRGGEYVSGGDTSLEVAEMMSDDLLDVDGGGMLGKDKGNPIAVAGGKRKGEDGSAEDGSDPFEGPVDNGAGNPQLRKKMDISEAPLSKLTSSERMRRKQRNWEN
eukprot:g28661.t1